MSCLAAHGGVVYLFLAQHHIRHSLEEDIAFMTLDGQHGLVDHSLQEPNA